MIGRKRNSKGIKADILMAGQSLTFKLDEKETLTLMKNLEDAAYDFAKMEAIKLYYEDGRLKSVVNPLQIARIWFT